ncbi:MAG: hypothetical protein GXP27_10660 [Planctomycetes bacterium]|nr:hypothetical protein [Planctomycetota bacterium]
MGLESVDVLLIGAADRLEMRPVRDALFQQIRVRRLHHSRDIPSALETVASESWYPHLVVVCQSWPDEFLRHDVQRLIGTLATSRLVCCYGAWCESDGRNRSIWPIAVRVPVVAAKQRIQRELEVLRGARLALPITASRDETFGFHAEPLGNRNEIWEREGARAAQRAQPDLPTRIEVVSPDKAFRHWIVDLLRLVVSHGVVAAAARCAAEPTEEPTTMAVWDLDPWGARIQERLKCFRRRQPDVPVIGLMAMPLPEDRQRVLPYGVVSLVSKQAATDELPMAVHTLFLSCSSDSSLEASSP